MIIFGRINEDIKRLADNFLALSVLQGFNYLLPLITFPYLVRVIGIEKYGLISFVTATITYFQYFTDYGFNLSATRQVSVLRDKNEKVNEIFSSVIFVKFLLLVISLIVLVLLIIIFQKFRENWSLFLLSFGMVIGNVLFPLWFFQGMEKMKYITVLNIVSKGLFTITIFLFVRQQSDYWKVPLFNSIGFVLSGIISLWLAFRNFGISLKIPHKESFRSQIREGFYLFIGSMSINFYKKNSIFILGLFFDNVTVGYFSIIKVFIDALNQISAVISQTIYPFISRLINNNYSRVTGFLRKIGYMIGVYTVIIGIICEVFSSEIVRLITGNIYKESILILQMLSFVPFFIGVNVPAVQFLLGKGYFRRFAQAVILGSIIDVILNFILVPSYSYIGSSISVIFVEIFITIYLYLQVLNIKKNYESNG